MKFSWSEPGALVSPAIHVALLLATLIAFSGAGKFDDVQEPVAIETVTDAQFNQIMRGDKKGEKSPQPHPKVEKVADAEVQKPTPPTPDAKTDVPAPPPALKHTADPGQDDEAAEAPKPPTPVAALPPPRPEPEKLEPPIPEPRPQPPTPPTPPKVQAEAKKPPPPPKPDAEPIENAGKPTTKAEVQAPPPLPPVKPRLPEKKEAAKPKTEPKPLHDQVAQLLEEKRLEEIAAAAEKPVKPTSKPPAKPKSGDETAKPTRRPDFDAIRQLVSHEDPQSTGSTGRQLKRVASLGSANSDDEKTTPSKLNELDDMLIEQYKSCWTLQGYSEGKHYVALISAEYYRDGTLKGEPVLQNTPSDPALRVLAESALDAVRKCNPLRIPPEFQSSSYYNYWRGPRSVKFDPAEMLN